jgi:shikimate 5-dehydrogenase
MLVHQGALSLARWTGLPLERIPVHAMTEAVRRTPHI